MLYVPLVLHGGSGFSDEGFCNSISAGILTIHIITDVCLSGSRVMQFASEKRTKYLGAR